MSVIGEKDIVNRFEVWSETEVFPLTAAESYYYRKHVVQRRFAFLCMKSGGLPTTGYFFPDKFPFGKLVDMFGHIDLKAGPCEAIQVKIGAPDKPNGSTRLKKPEFTAGVLTLKCVREIEFSTIAYSRFLGPQTIPYWQAKTWRTAGLSLSLSPDSRRRLKKAGDKLFEPQSSVTNDLSDKQKMLLVISLLYPTWEERKMKLIERTHHLQESGLKVNLAPSDLKNYCAEAGLEPLSRSQFIKRITAIVKASDRYFKANPDALLDVESEPGIEPHKSVHFAIPSGRNSLGQEQDIE